MRMRFRFCTAAASALCLAACANVWRFQDVMLESDDGGSLDGNGRLDGGSGSSSGGSSSGTGSSSSSSGSSGGESGASNGSSTSSGVGSSSGASSSGSTSSGMVDAYVAPLPALAAPTFMPPTGTALNGPTNVTIVPPAGFPTTGFIYYTTNGTNPNPNSLVYAGPIQVSQAETIRAYASAPGFQDSMIVAATYTVAPPSDAGCDLQNIPTGCPDCMTENASFMPVCQEYLMCFSENGCNPSNACGSNDGVCGVNTIGGGEAPYQAAVTTYNCACP